MGLLGNKSPNRQTRENKIISAKEAARLRRRANRLKKEGNQRKANEFGKTASDLDALANL